MAKVKFNGPSGSINVEPYGRHAKGEVKDYPDGFAADLIDSSNRNRFELVGEAISETPTDGAPQSPPGGVHDSAFRPPASPESEDVTPLKIVKKGKKKG